MQSKDRPRSHDDAQHARLPTSNQAVTNFERLRRMVHQLKAPRRELPVASDPDGVSEIICDGRLNFTTRGSLATLTFFHDRPKLSGSSGQVEYESVVRARIILPLQNAVALRDLISKCLSVRECGGDRPN